MVLAARCVSRDPLEAAGRDCEYFTMLRNPIERLVSAFYYCPTDHDPQGRPSKVCMPSAFFTNGECSERGGRFFAIMFLTDDARVLTVIEVAVLYPLAFFSG